MPKSTKPRRLRGARSAARPSTQAAIRLSKPGKPPKPPVARDPVQRLRTQTRGGRPPRFPSRTGGR